MSIDVQYWGNMVEITGKKQEELTADSVGDILSCIKKQYGKEGLKEAKRMIIAVNGTSIQMLERYKTVLAEGDKVVFLPLCAGG